MACFTCAQGLSGRCWGRGRTSDPAAAPPPRPCRQAGRKQRPRLTRVSTVPSAVAMAVSVSASSTNPRCSGPRPRWRTENTCVPPPSPPPPPPPPSSPSSSSSSSVRDQAHHLGPTLLQAPPPGRAPPSRNTAPQALFLQLRPRVPLNTPH
ncbi:hypothetical protein AAFF_G00252430 [Aldrovandia affinis]|uniref:Uncharacterized protein n=1 Tax=Aldrovandia affinis TaxID=143900 RepID=A0AAD7STW9_9TELE|nr:hypothetical protein AAFF_G00252430 [Aldrovandia affinis]